jgi:hypothetical protein
MILFELIGDLIGQVRHDRRMEKERTAVSQGKQIAHYRTTGDGIRPKKVPWGAFVQCPVPLSKGATMTVDLGVEFDRPATVYPSRMARDYGLTIKGPAGEPTPFLLLPNEEFTVTVTAPSGFEATEQLVYVVFIPDAPELIGD